MLNNKIWKDIFCTEEGNSWGKLKSRNIIKELYKICTPKQRFICNLLAKGYSYMYIAKYLGLDKTTIRDHMKAIREKARLAIRLSI